MGGHGYSRDYTLERFFRDDRGLMLRFKTSEWLRQDIARAVVGILSLPKLVKGDFFPLPL